MQVKIHIKMVIFGCFFSVKNPVMNLMFFDINIPVVPIEIWLQVTHNQRQKTLKVTSVLLFCHILKTKSWLECGCSLLNSWMWPRILCDAQVKFQMPAAPNRNKQCILMYKQQLVFCNIKWFKAYPATSLDKDKLEHTCPSLTWLIFCSEIAFVTLENFWEGMVLILVGNFDLFFKVWGLWDNLLCFFCDGTWYAWTFLLPSMWLYLPWWIIVQR